jgi:hypothetical protein
MKLSTLIERPRIGYPIFIGVVLGGIALILHGLFAVGCIVGGAGVGFMFRIAQANGHYLTRIEEGDKMKQLFVKYAKLCYGISITLWIGAVVLSFHGGYDEVSSWVGIGGIALALLVADANGRLVPRKQNKD